MRRECGGQHSPPCEVSSLGSAACSEWIQASARDAHLTTHFGSLARPSGREHSTELQRVPQRNISEAPALSDPCENAAEPTIDLQWDDRHVRLLSNARSD